MENSPFDFKHFFSYQMCILTLMIKKEKRIGIEKNHFYNTFDAYGSNMFLAFKNYVWECGFNKIVHFYKLRNMNT